MAKFEDIFQDSKDYFNPDQRKKVGGYLLGVTIGQGAFAQVRIAKHLLSGEKVAVKCTYKKLAKKKNFINKNMRRESHMLQRLQHPHIVKVFEVMETDNFFYMVMELIPSRFIKYLNGKGALTEREARNYFRQILSAVDHMHKAGVVHRDLKVDNLLLDRYMNIKIIDFGLSNECGHGDLLLSQCGSPAYAAPEIFSKQKYGPAVDIWTIGVDLYLMVTGDLPFTVKSPVNLTLLHAKMLKGCQCPRNISEVCQDLIGKLLDPSDETRIQMEELFEHPWVNHGYPPLVDTKPVGGISVSSEINCKVADYMAKQFGMSESELDDIVQKNIPGSLFATYNMLCRRLQGGHDLNLLQFGVESKITPSVRRLGKANNDVSSDKDVTAGQSPKDSLSEPQLLCVDRAVPADDISSLPSVNQQESDEGSPSDIVKKTEHSVVKDNDSCSSANTNYTSSVLTATSSSVSTAKTNSVRPAQRPQINKAVPYNNPYGAKKGLPNSSSPWSKNGHEEKNENMNNNSSVVDYGSKEYTEYLKKLQGQRYRPSKGILKSRENRPSSVEAECMSNKSGQVSVTDNNTAKSVRFSLSKDEGDTKSSTDYIRRLSDHYEVVGFSPRRHVIEFDKNIIDKQKTNTKIIDHFMGGSIERARTSEQQMRLLIQMQRRMYGNAPPVPPNSASGDKPVRFPNLHEVRINSPASISTGNYLHIHRHPYINRMTIPSSSGGSQQSEVLERANTTLNSTSTSSHTDGVKPNSLHRSNTMPDMKSKALQHITNHTPQRVWSKDNQMKSQGNYYSVGEHSRTMVVGKPQHQVVLQRKQSSSNPNPTANLLGGNTSVSLIHGGKKIRLFNTTCKEYLQLMKDRTVHRTHVA